MYLNPTIGAALDRIAERAADVRRAFVPGSVAQSGDVANTLLPPFTLDPLSAVPPEGAYFVTTDPRGRAAYTRDGNLTLRDGTLVCSDGRPVLGTRAPSAALSELHVDPVDAALDRVIDPRVEPDGTFAYTRTAIDPRTGQREPQRVAAGRIALARFPASTPLSGAEGRQFVAPEGVVPHIGSASDGSFGKLLPMHRTPSGVDLDASLARLKDAYVAFDALQAAETAKGHTGKVAMDLLK